ncbi:MAG: hypothetical protein WBE76_04670 [Terracidiphilus sp.]
MIARVALLLTIVPSATALAQTANRCPWFSSGSAAKILGGNISLVANADGNWDGSCHFIRSDEGKPASIDILIGKVDTHPCPQGSVKINALGNEALQCSHPTLGSQHVDVIAGRMRDVYFVVSMTDVPNATRQLPSDSHLSGPFGASLLERVAEQVVGNLY